MKNSLKQAYMRVAYVFADLSYCTRRKVGCVVVKDDRIISVGFNGTPSGDENICEFVTADEDGSEISRTKPSVLHAETNAITKLAKSTESGDGAYLFTTTAPCMDCAKLIFQSGISHVFYRETYRCTEGIKFLIRKGVISEQI